MKLKTYLFVIFSMTLLSLGIWLMILFNIDPDSADLITKSAFFSSMFLWLMGIMIFIIFYLRIWVSNKEVIYNNLPIALRHAIFISLVITGLLALNSSNLLNWWDAGMFIVVITMLELLFRQKTTN
ncbi:MAG: hypothetical protein ACD_58C00242G0001 [uncultured bacterium]|nr:MAG: hypothetical protein ACD_58C00242G0001 [uncultured bacterium]